jgi:hypothetical protein
MSFNEDSRVKIPTLLHLTREFVKPIGIQKQKNLKQNQQLASLHDWLLPILMNGQVRVGAMDVAAEPGGEYKSCGYLYYHFHHYYE